MLLLVFAHGAFVMSVYAIKAGFSILYQAGSWAGPGPGPPWLGLKCYLAWGGPGWRGDIAMTWQEHGDRMTTTYHSRPREMIDATCVVEHLIFIEKQKNHSAGAYYTKKVSKKLVRILGPSRGPDH